MSVQEINKYLVKYGLGAETYVQQMVPLPKLCRQPSPQTAQKGPSKLKTGMTQDEDF
jgi:hypothetical protein